MAATAPSTTPSAKGEQRAGQPEPRGQHRHQLGVAQADALAPANQLVDPADEQNETGGGEDREQFRRSRARGQISDSPNCKSAAIE